MNKLEFMNEIGVLADKFAFLLERYTECHDGYAGMTDDNKSIVLGQISVSIQDGALATISADVSSHKSEHKIRIIRFPNINNVEWRIEDK